MGKGPAPSRLMFIGEAPGEEEDRLGEPFVGKTGKLLDSILVNREIDRATVYITNIAKCRPPFNSKPPVDWLEICSSTYLAQEIKLVQPELIVCLGGLSAKTLLQDHNVNIAMVRNRLHYTHWPLPSGIPFIVTYHPAATFHKPETLANIIDDLDWAKRLLAGELPKPDRKLDYKIIQSIRDIPEIKTSWISVDLETDGLDPFAGKDIFSVQISTAEGNGYYLDWNGRVAKEVEMLLNGYNLNNHNIKYDLKWLRSKGIRFNGKINDTIQNVHLLDENMYSKSLDVVATTFTPLKRHKKQFRSLMNLYFKTHKKKKEPIAQARVRLEKQAFYSISPRIRMKYGCGDADATGRLRTVFRPKLKEAGLIPLHNLMMDVTKLFVEVECNGIKVDMDYLKILEDKYSKGLVKIRSRMDKIVPNLNPGSWKQLRALIYGKWKCEPHEVRVGKKKVRYSTGKDAIELILQDDIDDNVRTYLTRLLKFRQNDKMYGTFIKGMPRYLRNGNLIHAEWNMVGTDTGRFSCSNPNLQQLPRKGPIKGLFISRFRKGLVGAIDVSQGELRWGACIANEPHMIELFNQPGDVDIHRSMASLLLGIPESQINEDQRFNVKTVNFLIFYGGGARTMAQSMKGVTQQQAIDFIRRWHEEFPRIKEHFREVEAFVMANQFVRNPFGRYRHLLILDPSTDDGRTQIRQAINSPIQGGLSDYNKVCGVMLWRRLQKEGLDKKCLIIGETHDEWKLDFKDEKTVSRVYPIIKEVFEHDSLEHIQKEFGFKLKVPMRVEVKVGYNLYEMESYQ
jgi:DNA polymerase-1